ncbi:ComF family protein [Streptomyces spectabilis]|uniref:ComF family protein n=1 Tax=Streptomyces spectabilis TaxID=68270 RepID=A0A516R8B5_STRST|nr:ComF family protein [Streptomyces spectabilis]QDQ11902.1 ComF family protein [Streptomyces spectabilis]
MRGWWQDLTDLVLPAECEGCGMPRAALCARCRAALCGAAPRRVRPVPEPRGLPVVHAAAAYQEAVRAVLLAHKERGALALVGPLGEALAGAVRASLTYGDEGVRGAQGARGTTAEGAGAVPVLLVPVPSAGRAVRARGHDPVRRIALAAAGELRRLGVPARVLGALRQRRPVADQAGLNSRERRANLSGALGTVPGAGPLLRGAGHVVVVDDLMTTGASLAEAVRALGGVDGVQGEGDDQEHRTGRHQARNGAENQTRNQPSRGEENGAAGVLVNALVVGAKGAAKMVSAAVVAASPDSFEINRN